MKLFLLIVALTIVVIGHGKPPDTHPPTETEPTLSEQPEAFKSSFKISNDDTYGPPISPDEMAAAIANSSLVEPSPGDDHAIENSGEFEGDIILTPQQQAQIEMGGRSAKFSSTWDKGVIPYKISSVFSYNERQMIARAMVEYHSKTCIKFVDQTTETDWVYIQRGLTGCSSYIGPIGGRQPIKLKEWCFGRFGTILHELMHCAGFYHEQARTDRDEYVTVHWDNIEEDKQRNFRKYDQSVITNFGTPYDYGSVMHYGRYGFAKDDDKPTLTPIKPGVTIGQRVGFSELDVRELNLLYDCGGPSYCQFPFIYNGVSYSACTTTDDPDGKPWCSTKTDDLNNHIGGNGNWKHCTSPGKAKCKPSKKCIKAKGKCVSKKCKGRIIRYGCKKSKGCRKTRCCAPRLN